MKRQLSVLLVGLIVVCGVGLAAQTPTPARAAAPARQATPPAPPTPQQPPQRVLHLRRLPQ